MSLGAYLGILCDTKFFKGTHRNIHETSIAKGIIRLIFTLAIFTPFLVIIDTNLASENYIQLLFLTYIVPAFVSNFLFYAFSRPLFAQCKLVASDVQPAKSSVVVSNPDDGGERLSDFSYDSEEEEEQK